MRVGPDLATAVVQLEHRPFGATVISSDRG
jgi:hypothetical protein